MNRIYEELFIVKPDATDEEVDGVIEQISGVVKTAGGTIDKVDKWGKRRLAYRIDKYGEGIYVLVTFSTKADTVKEVERRLRVTDSVIKFLTVRIDETLKWLEKRTKIRDKRAHKRPQMSTTPVPDSPSAPAMPAEAPAAVIPGAPAPGAPVPAEPEIETAVAVEPEPTPVAE